MSSSGGVWSSVPVNSNVVELEFGAGFRSIDVSGGAVSMPSTIDHSYSAGSCSVDLARGRDHAQVVVARHQVLVRHRRRAGLERPEVERALEGRVGHVGVEVDDRLRAQRLAAGGEVERRLGRREAGRLRIRPGQELGRDAQQAPGVGRGLADVALEVDRADVEGVRADLGLLEAPLEAALRHVLDGVEAARLVAEQVDLALEGHVGLVRVEREERVGQPGLGRRREVDDRLRRVVRRQRLVGPGVLRRGRVGEQAEVDRADLDRVLARAQVRELGRVLAVLPGERVLAVDAALEHELVLEVELVLAAVLEGRVAAVAEERRSRGDPGVGLARAPSRCRSGRCSTGAARRCPRRSCRRGRWRRRRRRCPSRRCAARCSPRRCDRHPFRPMPSPPLPSASLRSSRLPWPAGGAVVDHDALAGVLARGVEHELVVRREALDRDAGPERAAALLISSLLFGDSVTSMPLLLPARLFARTSVSRASSSVTALPFSAPIRFSRIRLFTESMTLMPPLCPTIVLRSTTLSFEGSSSSPIATPPGLSSMSLAASVFSRPPWKTTAQPPEPVMSLASMRLPRACSSRRPSPLLPAMRVVADDGVARAAVDRDPVLVDGDRVAADRVAVGGAVGAELVGVRERDPGLLVQLQPQVRTRRCARCRPRAARRSRTR